MRYRHECGTRSDDYVAAIVGGAGLMPFRPECGSWSHYVGLLFAHWPDFGCLLSMNSTLANSSCDCGCLLSHNSPLANSNSWDWGQVFANSTRANSDLGGSILAKKTLTKARSHWNLTSWPTVAWLLPTRLLRERHLPTACRLPTARHVPRHLRPRMFLPTACRLPIASWPTAVLARGP